MKGPCWQCVASRQDFPNKTSISPFVGGTTQNQLKLDQNSDLVSLKRKQGKSSPEQVPSAAIPE